MPTAAQKNYFVRCGFSLDGQRDDRYTERHMAICSDPETTYPDLRTFLRETGRTQMRFAEELGVAQSTVSEWINGVYSPSLAMAAKILELAPIPLESLIPKRSRASR
jgi:DNA-binding XRE family transcriptional regulator